MGDEDAATPGARGERSPYVHEAELRLAGGADPRAPGGAVTVALCGSWSHDGPCRWPHHSALVPAGGGTTLRTVFAAPPGDEDEIRARIERALRADRRWEVLRSGEAELDESERPLASRLAAAPEPR
jgi:hypothetical protein